MYNHKLKFADQMFESGMTLPANTSTAASTAMRVGGTAGKVAITVVAADTDVALAITKKFTISYTECATEDGSFAAPAAATSVVRTFAAAYDPAVGDVMATLVVPTGAAKWVKAVLTTDDAAAAGTVDVFIEYLA